MEQKDASVKRQSSLDLRQGVRHKTNDIGRYDPVPISRCVLNKPAGEEVDIHTVLMGSKLCA